MDDSKIVYILNYGLIDLGETMSGEQISAKELNKSINHESLNNAGSPRVNINNLLHKVREEKTREKKENYVFLGLVVGVLAVTGVIASL